MGIKFVTSVFSRFTYLDFRGNDSWKSCEDSPADKGQKMSKYTFGNVFVTSPKNERKIVRKIDLDCTSEATLWTTFYSFL